MEPIKTIGDVCLGYFTLNGERYKIVTYETIIGSNSVGNLVTVCIISPEGQGHYGNATTNETNTVETAIDRALQVMQFVGVKCDIDSKTILKTLKQIN